MPLISGTIPSFIGGVSQQDASVRQASQLQECLNCNLSPARGAGPRPPARFVGVLGSDIPDDAFFHTIVRDNREHYVVCIYGTTVRVFDHFTGKEYMVVVDSGSTGYLKTKYGPDVSLRAVTVGDYTVIVNREVVVAMSKETAPSGVTYLNGRFEDLDPLKMSAAMLGWASKNYLPINNPSSGTVQTFQDLPKNALVGSIWEVRGDGENSFDNYFVQCESSKVWREVPKPGTANTLSPSTMPHGLKRIPDGTNPDGFYFSYGPLEYDKRYTGDELSCPPPSFVGQTIGNLAYHKDRLVLLSGGNVILSEVGHYLNFWRTTITSLLDSDVIDVTVPTSGVAQLTHAVSYQQALLLFGSGKVTMFQLTGTPVLSPKTAKIDVVTTFQVSPYVTPVMAGSSVFFVDDSSAKPWATVREYFVQSDQVTPEAANATAHVPHYVPGNTRCMAAAENADMVFIAHRSPTGSQVYVHQFRWAGDEKQQSAWLPWKIEQVGAVLHMHAIGTDLFLIAKSPGGGVEMLTMDLGQAPTTPEVSADFDVCLDRRELVTPYHQQFGNYTEFTVPFILPTLDRLAVLKTVDWDTPGSYLDLAGATLTNGGQTLRLPGDHSTGRVVLGYQYTRRITISQQYVKDQNGIAKLSGRLQLRRMTVRFSSAAFFRCLVYPKGRPEAIDTLVPQLSSTFTSRTAGDAAFLLDTPQVTSGTHSFLVASRSDSVDIAFDSDSPFPAWWQSAQWEATYTPKARM